MNEDTAVQKRNRGYNCAQAVLCTYCEMFGLDEASAFRLSEGLGSGLGCTLGTCGALEAACMLAGMKMSSANLDRPDSKGRTYPLAARITKEFEKQAGALRCRDIKGIETGEVKCECEECVRISCRIIDELLIKDQ